MIMRIRLPLALACVAYALVQPAHADVLRCGTDLIEQGDSAARVVEKCGEPTSKSMLEEPVWSQYPNGTVYQSGTLQSELWRYNFGPNRFPALLKITNGVVQGISFEKNYG
jgi:Protein of unknown function (DUF2845)